MSENKPGVTKLQELAHFLYGRGFWYAHPLREIEGLTEEQLFWVPDEKSLPIIWQVGHIAGREKLHVGIFLQGKSGDIIPGRYRVFMDEHTPEEIRRSMGPMDDFLAWVREAREEVHAYIDSLTEEELCSVPSQSEGGLPAAYWLFITVSHTALHIGRIQLLRALIEGTRERAC